MAHGYDYNETEYFEDNYVECEDCLYNNWSSCLKCEYPKVFPNIQEIKQKDLSKRNENERRILYLVKHSDIYHFVIVILMYYRSCSCCGHITISSRCGCRETSFDENEYQKFVVDMELLNEEEGIYILNNFKYNKICVSNTDDYSNHRLYTNFVYNTDDIILTLKSFIEAYRVLKNSNLPSELNKNILNYLV